MGSSLFSYYFNQVCFAFLFVPDKDRHFEPGISALPPELPSPLYSRVGRLRGRGLVPPVPFGDSDPTKQMSFPLSTGR